MSVSTGLISGIDYSTMISQLMQVEANPQTLLKNQLVAAQADATAYRAVNTRFESLRTAAAALTADTAWTSTKATSSAPSVSATAGSAALAGSSLTFSVTELAAAHSEISNADWASTDTLFGATSFSVTSGGTTTDIPITTTNAAGPTLADAVAAINASDTGLTATAVRITEGQYRLQVTARATGAAGAFTVGDDTTFKTVTTGTNAQLSVGSGEGAYTVQSDTNTFTGLMTDTTITVSKKGDTATVSVAKDPDVTAAKVQSLVDAANSLFESITAYTDKDSKTASLKGDTALRGLATQILGMVASGIGGKSASTVGIQLTQAGTLTFDKAAFTAKLASDPAAVKDLLAAKTTVGPGADGISGNADDVTTPVGLAAQLEVLAKKASDSTTGTLTLLATSSDSTAKDLTARIEAWDTRLAMRKDSLTRQFTAMEKALGTMQNQASWLSSQIAGLPSWSKSNS
ncbi:hypothetical protein A7K94_0202430 [Modestobacter sp. VKM Ac-2676]|nr:hypothetical protein A7K94_0202430 [Modestobacter sp. VKM Ac-2676]